MSKSRKVKLYVLTYLKYLLLYSSVLITALLLGLVIVKLARWGGLPLGVVRYGAMFLTAIFMLFGVFVKDLSNKYQLTVNYFRTALTLLFLIDAGKYSDHLVTDLLSKLVWLLPLVVLSMLYNKLFSKMIYHLLDFSTLQIDFLASDDEMETALGLKEAIKRAVAEELREAICVQVSLRKRDPGGNFGHTIRFNLVQPILQKQFMITLFDSSITYTLPDKENDHDTYLSNEKSS